MKRIGIFLIGSVLIPVGVLFYFSPWEQTPQEQVVVHETETLDDCLRFMQYLSFGVGEELDAVLEEKLQHMDSMLQRGARPTEYSRDLLPMDCRLRERVTSILEKHGIHIQAGESPENPCCVPY